MIDNYPLIVDRRGSQLSVRDGQLRIKTPDDIAHVPLNLLSTMVIAVNCELTTSLLQQLAENGVITVILPTRGRGEPAWVTPGLSNSWRVRKQQYQHQNNPELAWYWVERKLYAQRHTLKLLQCPLGVLEKIEKPATFELDTIMGMEGAAARHYFQQLAKVIPEQWNFSGRNRQPPQDPFNALLSLSYTLFTTEAVKSVQYHGFDPWAGFLHQPYPGRPALALDLIEPFRPQIDLWCIGLIDLLDDQLHFHTEEGKVLLNKKGRNIYFSAWAQDRQNWHDEKSVPQLMNQMLAAFKTELEQIS
jgi:CRISPR-associated protein Cas1